MNANARITIWLIGLSLRAGSEIAAGGVEWTNEFTQFAEAGEWRVPVRELQLKSENYFHFLGKSNHN